MGEQIPLHQMYCTHCTYGSSALEQRNGQGADRVMGYGPRASSMSRNELMRLYRIVERYTYYYLPTDTPVSKQKSYPVDEAPLRLVFHPSASGNQMAGQVSFRAFDTEGRPGSYFAHVLVAPRIARSSPWSIFDCLQLWGSPDWVKEDDLEGGFELSPLSQLGDMSSNAAMAMNDEVFLDFLSQPPQGSFRSNLITPRWRAMPAAERRRLFVQALTGHLQIARTRRRDSLLLVVEPQMSIVFFYGIARLLPRPMREELSFSTYETSAQRLCTTLAALTFDDPLVSDLKPEQYQRGNIVNTFLDKCSPSRPEGTGPFDAIVAGLESEPDAALREIRAILEYEGGACKNIVQLDEIDEAAAYVPRLFLGNAANASELTPPWGGRKGPSKLQSGYLRAAVQQRMSGPADKAMLSKLLATPVGLLTVLELTELDSRRAKSRSKLSPSLAFLASRLPENAFPRVLSSNSIPADFKFAALLHFINERESLPGGCDVLWDEVKRASERGGEATLLEQVLGSTKASVIKRLLVDLPPIAGPSFFIALLESTSPAHASRAEGEVATRQKILQSMIESFDAEQLGSVLEHLESSTRTLRREVDRAINLQLEKVLDSLPKQADKHFTTRLTTLISNRERLSEDSKQRVEAWLAIKYLLTDAKRDVEAKPRLWERFGGRTSFDSEDLGKRLAIKLECAQGADGTDLSGDPDAEASSVDLHCIREIAANLGVDQKLLPPQFEEKAQRFLGPGNLKSHWPGAPKASRKRTKEQNIGAMSIAIAILIVGGGLGIWRYFGAPKAPEIAKDDSDDPSSTPATTPTPTPEPTLRDTVADPAPESHDEPSEPGPETPQPAEDDPSTSQDNATQPAEAHPEATSEQPEQAPQDPKPASQDPEETSEQPGPSGEQPMTKPVEPIQDSRDIPAASPQRKTRKPNTPELIFVRDGIYKHWLDLEHGTTSVREWKSPGGQSDGFLAIHGLETFGEVPVYRDRFLGFEVQDDGETLLLLVRAKYEYARLADVCSLQINVADDGNTSLVVSREENPPAYVRKIYPLLRWCVVELPNSDNSSRFIALQKVTTNDGRINTITKKEEGKWILRDADELYRCLPASELCIGRATITFGKSDNYSHAIDHDLGRTAEAAGTRRRLELPKLAQQRGLKIAELRLKATPKYHQLELKLARKDDELHAKSEELRREKDARRRRIQDLIDRSNHAIDINKSIELALELAELINISTDGAPPAPASAEDEDVKKTYDAWATRTIREPAENEVKRLGNIIDNIEAKQDKREEELSQEILRQVQKLRVEIIRMIEIKNGGPRVLVPVMSLHWDREKEVRRKKLIDQFNES